jgi:chemotaxis protein MotB
MAKRKHEVEHENHERWLVSYADFITLLFAFFTVLYATSQHDVSKAQEFQRSIQKAFRSFIDFGGLMGKYVDHNEATQFIPPPIDVVPQEGTGPKETQDYVERQIDKQMTQGEQKDFIEDIRSDAVGVRVNLAASSFFDAGSALIKEDALPALDKIGNMLERTTNKLIIEGHTDTEPINTGKFPSNWELSAARASTIVRYLIRIHSISASRMVAVGYADQRPLVPNTTSAGRAKNRRIEILIVTDPSKTVL